MDVDIRKPDTGLVKLQRPSHTHTSVSSNAGSSGALTPIDIPGYTEPVSEGEDEDENDQLVPARDQGAATRLSTTPYSQDAIDAVAFREKIRRERIGGAA